MRRTRKWAYVHQEAERLAALNLSAAEIGRRLDINKSTIGRWIKAGKLTTATRAEQVEAVSPRARQTPGEWAESVRQEYDLDTTDDQLLSLAEQSLTDALNPKLSANVRALASGRFQAIVRQLALVSRAGQQEKPATPDQPAADAPEPVAPVVQRPRTDPRGILAAVNG